MSTARETEIAKFSWKDAPDLMEALVAAQNHPYHANQDIMTFAGFMETREELELYVGRAEIRCQVYDQDVEMGNI